MGGGRWVGAMRPPCRPAGAPRIQNDQRASVGCLGGAKAVWSVNSFGAGLGGGWSLCEQSNPGAPILSSQPIQRCSPLTAMPAGRADADRSVAAAGSAVVCPTSALRDAGTITAAVRPPVEACARCLMVAAAAAAAASPSAAARAKSHPPAPHDATASVGRDAVLDMSMNQFDVSAEDW